jgi:hypothetical protein
MTRFAELLSTGECGSRLPLRQHQACGSLDHQAAMQTDHRVLGQTDQELGDPLGAGDFLRVKLAHLTTGSLRGASRPFLQANLHAPVAIEPERGSGHKLAATKPPAGPAKAKAQLRAVETRPNGCLDWVQSCVTLRRSFHRPSEANPHRQREIRFSEW